MGRFLQYSIISLVVSMFYFSFGFTFLPPSINTKLLLSIGGLLIAAFDATQQRAVKLSPEMLGASGIAVLFSLICFIAVDFNYTTDFSYASYLVSFLVWIFAAYAVCTVIRWVHGQVSISLITCYLAGVCALQCVLALLINSIPELQVFVNAYVEQGQDLLLEVNRLYGVGASLDNAGVRFSIVLILIAATISKDAAIQRSTVSLTLLLSAFFTILIIGNMISRTTSIGSLFALIYLIWGTGLLRMVIRANLFSFHLLFGLMLLLATVVTVYFFRTDEVFNAQIRFAFEGFFNWVEKGEWRTDSTDKLNRNMWIWPSDTKTWLIGTGLFEDWIFGTDIGYCRFILYCGLPGFTVFALFFVYHSVVFSGIYPAYRDIFLVLLALSFIIWIKVSTDLFLIYALFYCMHMFKDEGESSLPEGHFERVAIR